MLTMKVLILGDSAVGKTSLRDRYMGRGFKINYLLKIGADFVIRELTFQDGTAVTLQIWNISGPLRRTEELTIPFYQGAVGALMVYDVTRFKTLENVTKWIAEIRKYHQIEYFPIILIGNKIDIRESIVGCISTSQGDELTKSLESELYNNNWRILFIETSAKTGEKVEDAFVNLGKASIEFYKKFKSSVEEK